MYLLDASARCNHVCGLDIEVLQDRHNELCSQVSRRENPRYLLQLTSMRSFSGTRGTPPTPGRSTTIRRNPYPRARGSGRGQSPGRGSRVGAILSLVLISTLPLSQHSHERPHIQDLMLQLCTSEGNVCHGHC